MRAGARARCPRPSCRRWPARTLRRSSRAPRAGYRGRCPRRRSRPGRPRRGRRCRRGRPLGVNLTALETRLKTIWRTRRSSAVIVISSGSVLRASAMPPPLARSLSIETALLQNLGNRDRRELQLHPAGLDLGEVEDVVDQREQMLAGFEHVVDVGELALVQLAEHLLVQHLAEADDRVQRRSQLVRHRGEEVGLVAARRLELAVQRARARRSSGSPSRRGCRSRRGSGPRVALPNSPAAISSRRSSVRRRGTTTDQASRRPSASASSEAAAPTPIRRLRELANELRLAATSAFARARVSRASAPTMRREGGRESVGAPKGRLRRRRPLPASALMIG